MTGIAVGADASNPDVLRLTDTCLCGFGVIFIDTWARSDVACFGKIVVGLSKLAHTADSVDDVVSCSAVAIC